MLQIQTEEKGTYRGCLPGRRGREEVGGRGEGGRGGARRWSRRRGCPDAQDSVEEGEVDPGRGGRGQSRIRTAREGGRMSCLRGRRRALSRMPVPGGEDLRCVSWLVFCYTGRGEGQAYSMRGRPIVRGARRRALSKTRAMSSSERGRRLQRITSQVSNEQTAGKGTRERDKQKEKRTYQASTAAGVQPSLGLILYAIETYPGLIIQRERMRYKDYGGLIDSERIIESLDYQGLSRGRGCRKIMEIRRLARIKRGMWDWTGLWRERIMRQQSLNVRIVEDYVESWCGDYVAVFRVLVIMLGSSIRVVRTGTAPQRRRRRGQSGGC
ncbi:hypothetical protein B0H12DRAFT_1077689 [Mycena haematopus]|nr:hypothetical protein B0H12DRAFT_1077689 [Mycena haematopus]